MLLTLPAELCLHTARQVLAKNLPSALHLLCCCKDLHSKLAAVSAEARRRRLQWEPGLGCRMELSDAGCTVTNSLSRISWHAGSLLRAEGKQAWRIRLQRAKHPDARGVCIGVCNEDATCNYSLALSTGVVGRWNNYLEDTSFILRAAPPLGFPEVQGAARVMDYGEWGDEPAHRDGAVIEVVFDIDAGTLSFGVNGATPRLAVSGFPARAAVRPYVELWSMGDKLSFAPPYLL
jgi:hypothetical protein